jgi:hypothetical protein
MRRRTLTLAGLTGAAVAASLVGAWAASRPEPTETISVPSPQGHGRRIADGLYVDEIGIIRNGLGVEVGVWGVDDSPAAISQTPAGPQQIEIEIEGFDVPDSQPMK